jgi:epoxyqueuosine reductase QueG
MNDELMEILRSVARSLGIVDISVADARVWGNDRMTEFIPENQRPSSLMQGARSVIVLGIPVQRAILATAPSVLYSEHYKAINSMLDHAALRIAMELQIMGHEAMPLPRDGYRGIEGLRKDPSFFFSHRHAAYLAGMGTFGISNMLLTKKNGPRIRFVSLITDAELPYASPLKGTICTECMQCRTVCPCGAVASKMYPEGITTKPRCVEISASLRETGRSPCGRCIFVCPVGEDAQCSLPTDDAIERVRSY